MSKHKNPPGTSPTTQIFSEDLEAQRAFCREAGKRLKTLPLIDTEAFVEGMRDSGYRTTGTALDEFIDNAIQAQATQIDIIVHLPEENTGKKKLTSEVGGGIAVVDNGHGMDPEMLRIAVMWGGTHRQNSRTGLGRYGFGLPSAAVSISRKFAVYSKVPGGKWHCIEIDLKAIADGAYRNEEGSVEAPLARPVDLPEFVKEKLKGGDLTHGTVVVLDHLDRLTNGYKTARSFKEKVLHGIGLIYRNFMSDIMFRVVDGEATVVEPIDPLFLTPTARFYDENPIKAKAIPEALIRVKRKDGVEGTVRIRYSLMPFEFMKDGTPRFKVRKANSGIIVLRKGRQVDIVTTECPWHSWVNYDRYVGVELDFDPVLDEEFGVTVNKQQIRISESMWGILEANGLKSAMSQLFADFKKSRHESEIAEDKTKEGPRESEEIAAETEAFRRRKAIPSPPEREQEARQNLAREVSKKSQETGKTEEEILAEISGKPYKVELESSVEGPFYRVEQIGGQRKLYINVSHRFYTDVYNGLRPSKRMQTALELLLLTLGECELESNSEKARFYKYERVEWSRRFEVMLEQLDKRNPIAEAQESDEASA